MNSLWPKSSCAALSLGSACSSISRATRFAGSAPAGPSALYRLMNSRYCSGVGWRICFHSLSTEAAVSPGRGAAAASPMAGAAAVDPPGAGLLAVPLPGAPAPPLATGVCVPDPFGATFFSSDLSTRSRAPTATTRNPAAMPTSAAGDRPRLPGAPREPRSVACLA